MLDTLGQENAFFKIYLKSGSSEISIHPRDIEKTAITTKYGQFEYNMMAMGLCNVLATCQTLIISIFTEIIDDYVVVYLDGLLIFSKTEKGHLQHVKTVLKRLQENELYVSPKKCFFSKRK